MPNLEILKYLSSYDSNNPIITRLKKIYEAFRGSTEIRGESAQATIAGDQEASNDLATLDGIKTTSADDFSEIAIVLQLILESGKDKKSVEEFIEKLEKKLKSESESEKKLAYVKIIKSQYLKEKKDEEEYEKVDKREDKELLGLDNFIISSEASKELHKSYELNSSRLNKEYLKSIEEIDAVEEAAEGDNQEEEPIIEEKKALEEKEAFEEITRTYSDYSVTPSKVGNINANAEDDDSKKEEFTYQLKVQNESEPVTLKIEKITFSGAQEKIEYKYFIGDESSDSEKFKNKIDEVLKEKRDKIKKAYEKEVFNFIQGSAGQKHFEPIGKVIKSNTEDDLGAAVKNEYYQYKIEGSKPEIKLEILKRTTTKEIWVQSGEKGKMLQSEEVDYSCRMIGNKNYFPNQSEFVDISRLASMIEIETKIEMPRITQEPYSTERKSKIKEDFKFRLEEAKTKRTALKAKVIESLEESGKVVDNNIEGAYVAAIKERIKEREANRANPNSETGVNLVDDEQINEALEILSSKAEITDEKKEEINKLLYDLTAFIGINKEILEKSERKKQKQDLKELLKSDKELEELIDERENALKENVVGLVQGEEPSPSLTNFAANLTNKTNENKFNLTPEEIHSVISELLLEILKDKFDITGQQIKDLKQLEDLKQLARNLIVFNLASEKSLEEVMALVDEKEKELNSETVGHFSNYFAAPKAQEKATKLLEEYLENPKSKNFQDSEEEPLKDLKVRLKEEFNSVSRVFGYISQEDEATIIANSIIAIVRNLKDNNSKKLEYITGLIPEFNETYPGAFNAEIISEISKSFLKILKSKQIITVSQIKGFKESYSTLSSFSDPNGAKDSGIQSLGDFREELDKRARKLNSEIVGHFSNYFAVQKAQKKVTEFLKEYLKNLESENLQKSSQSSEEELLKELEAKLEEIFKTETGEALEVPKGSIKTIDPKDKSLIILRSILEIVKDSKNINSDKKLKVIEDLASKYGNSEQNDPEQKLISEIKTLKEATKEKATTEASEAKNEATTEASETKNEATAEASEAKNEATTEAPAGPVKATAEASAWPVKATTEVEYNNAINSFRGLSSSYKLISPDRAKEIIASGFIKAIKGLDTNLNDNQKSALKQLAQKMKAQNIIEESALKQIEEALNPTAEASLSAAEQDEISAEEAKEAAAEAADNKYLLAEHCGLNPAAKEARQATENEETHSTPSPSPSMKGGNVTNLQGEQEKNAQKTVI